jgi:hypothetical protein
MAGKWERLKGLEQPETTTEPTQEQQCHAEDSREVAEDDNQSYRIEM